MRKKILIVDDDATLIDTLCMAFELIGDFAVLKAQNGLDGVQKAEKFLPDIIVMDYKMPDINGWEATRRIKKNDKTKHIPVIGYTGWAGLSDIKKGIKAGLSEIINKPFNIEKWEEKINKYLGQD